MLGWESRGRLTHGKTRYFSAQNSRTEKPPGPSTAPVSPPLSSSAPLSSSQTHGSARTPLGIPSGIQRDTTHSSSLLLTPSPRGPWLAHVTSLSFAVTVGFFPGATVCVLGGGEREQLLVFKK